MNKIEIAFSQLFIDYATALPFFLQVVESSSVDELQQCKVLLYASLYPMVDMDDGASIQRILNRIYFPATMDLTDCSQPQSLLLNAIDKKYRVFELTPMGFAVCTYHQNAILALLADYQLIDDCMHQEYSDALGIVSEDDHASDDFIMFLVENEANITLGTLYSLMVQNRVELVKRILKTGKQYERYRSARAIVHLIDRGELYCVNPIQPVDSTQGKRIIQAIRQYAEEAGEQNRQALAQSIRSDADTCFRLDEERNCIMVCDEIIESIYIFSDDTRISIHTSNGGYDAEIDYEQKCCELFGGYIVCEDDVSFFIGAKLLSIYLTDTSLDTHIVNTIHDKKQEYKRNDYCNIQFINFKTTKGILQFVVYNCHNGHYGHDITIRKNSTVIYHDRI